MFKKAKLFAVLTALAVSLTGVATAFYGSAALAATPNMQGMNWFGGPVYNGKPNLEVTAALVDAGGGVEHFSFQQALVSMLGEKTVHAEVGKLTKQYGSKRAQARHGDGHQSAHGTGRSQGCDASQATGARGNRPARCVLGRLAVRPSAFA